MGVGVFKTGGIEGCITSKRDAGKGDIHANDGDGEAGLYESEGSDLTAGVQVRNICCLHTHPGQVYTAMCICRKF